MTRREVPVPEVVAQLNALGVGDGDVLLVHASFRAARPIARGPAGLIEALTLSLGPRGTLVMPSWTGDDDRPFDPAVTPAAPDLGILADTFWRQPGVRRGAHPFAFAAKGPHAAHILSDPLALPPHQRASAVGKVLDRDGRILLLGVGHDANTTLHLAELLAGVPYRRARHITVVEGGRPTRIDYLENDHCCQLFPKVDGWLRARGLQRDGLVGHAPSKLMRAQDLVAIAVPRLERDPFALMHPRGTDCAECADAWRSVPA